MNTVTRTFAATLAATALTLSAAPAFAVESDPYAYSSQPFTQCGAIYVNHVEGWSYAVEGDPVEQAPGQPRTEIPFPGGVQAEVTATSIDGDSRTFWLTVNPCTDWQPIAQRNAELAFEQRDRADRLAVDLASFRDLYDRVVIGQRKLARKVERQANTIERLRARLANR